MPGGVTWEIPPLTPTPAQPKTPAPKKTAAAPKNPVRVAPGGAHPVAPNRNFTPLKATPGPDFTGIIRGGIEKAAAHTPAGVALQAASAVIPRTPLAAVFHQAARGLGAAGHALDVGLGTTAAGLGALPGTLTTGINIRGGSATGALGAAHTPIENVKPETTAQAAAGIERPNMPKIGTAYLSAPYQKYFAGQGQRQVTLDDIHRAEAHFKQNPVPITPSGDYLGVPPVMDDAHIIQALKLAKANGHDLSNAKHWTFDDLISNALQKQHNSFGGFLRNTAGGLVQLSALPSGLVAGAAAGEEAMTGNTKPAQQFAHQFVEGTRNSLPLVGDRSFGHELYSNLPSVVANVMPVLRGTSGLIGKATLESGERDIHLPSTEGTLSEHVPPDLIARAMHEVKKNLIEKSPQRAGPLGRLGAHLEGKAEAGIIDRHLALGELKRDAVMMPVQRGLHEAARRTINREGAVPLVGAHTGGETRVAQITEATRAGKTPEEIARFREDQAALARRNEQGHLGAAKTLEQEARRHDAEGDHEIAAQFRRQAAKEKGKARDQAIIAENNAAHAHLMEGAKPIPENHPLVGAVKEASGYISDVKQELGMSEDARRFGDVQTKLHVDAADLKDTALHQAARNDNPDLHGMLEAQGRLARAKEAQHVLNLRQEAHDLSEVAKQRARGEDYAGRSHAERQASGGLHETELVSGREIGHIQTESTRLHAADIQSTAALHGIKGIAESPFTPHVGVPENAPKRPGEEAPRTTPERIRDDLNNIAELHINKERTRRTGIRNHIGTIRHLLSDPEISPMRATALRTEQKKLIDKLNSPSPRVIMKVQREIDAYLKRFGNKLTAKEKAKYQAVKIVKEALTGQARGDLAAVSKRSRKLETKIVTERANSSRTLKTEAERVNEKYSQALADYERHHGTGYHAPLSQPPVDRGGIRGFRNTTGRGILPRNRKLRTKYATGSQTLKATYAPERTLGGIFHEIRTISDHLASREIYHTLLRTDLVRPTAGLEHEAVPDGWHFVTADNLTKFTSHPSHVSSAEATKGLADEAAEGIKAGAWKDLLQEVKDVRAKPQALIPDEPGYLIRESALKALEESVRRHDAGDFQLLVKVTNEYRKALLFMLPRTFVNNMIGNVGLAMLSGAGMTDIIRAAHILRNHPEVIPSLIRNRGLIASQFGTEAAAGGWMDFWRRANTFAEDLGQAATYVAQLKQYGKSEHGLGATGAGGLLKGMDDISSEWHRVALDLAHGRDPNVLQLMQKSKQFFGDVAKQTRVNPALASSVLFHRWLAHIIRLVTITLPFKYPGRFNILLRISQIGDDYRKQHGVLPQWAQGVVRLAMNEVNTPKGVQKVVLGLSTSGMNPAQSFSQVADLGTDSNPIFPGRAIVGGALSPIISMPLAIATGQDPATGEPFRDQYGNPLSPDEMGALAGHLLWQNAPVLNTLESVGGTSADSQFWNPHVRASSPAAYRRQLVAPYMRPAVSPKDWWATILRGVGVPLTSIDSYGPRYNQHIASLAGALEQQAKDAGNKDITIKPPPTPVGAPTVAGKPETPAQRVAAQKAYAKKLREGSRSSVGASRKAQQDYAKKLRARG